MDTLFEQTQSLTIFSPFIWTLIFMFIVIVMTTMMLLIRSYYIYTFYAPKPKLPRLCFLPSFNNLIVLFLFLHAVYLVQTGGHQRDCGRAALPHNQSGFGRRPNNPTFQLHDYSSFLWDGWKLNIPANIACLQNPRCENQKL